MKISFCITCMNRLHHLMETLPINIFMALSYQNVEFSIVDYNSSDGLHQWAKQNLRKYEEQGLVKFLQTKKPTVFSASHAKNIAHKYASGDILCNLDADNFICEDFCHQIANMFTKDPNALMMGTSYDMFGNAGTAGRIILRREHFFSVNGYDEMHENWGWDDVNLQVRTQTLNNLNLYITPLKFIRCFGHNNYERTKNYLEKDVLNSQEKSITRIKILMGKKEYVANQDRKWGYAEDLKIGIGI